MNQTKKNKKRFETLRFAAAFLTIYTTVFLSCPDRGIISTFPILPIALAVISFFYDELIINTAISASAAVIFSLADRSDFKYTAIFTLAVAILTALVLLSTRMIKLALAKRAGRLALLAGILLFAVVFVVFFKLSGNPISAFKERAVISDYLEENYPGRKFDGISMRYSIGDAKYRSIVTYTDTGSPLEVEVYRKDGAWHDGYLDWLKQEALTTRRGELIDTIREKYDDRLGFRAAGISAPDGDLYQLTYKGDNSFIYGKMCFDISLNNIKSFKREFAAACEKFAVCLKDASFEFDTITFYGATDNDGQYLYQYRLTKESNLEKIIDDVEPFDSKNYISYSE